MKQEIATMPKVELHIHVEGATLPEAFFELANKNKVRLPIDSLEEWKEYFSFKDFSHFINVYDNAVLTLKRAEDYAFLIEKFYEYQENQGIVYSEAFLSASFIVEKFINEEILEAIQHGIKQGENKYKTKIKFIPDISRHLPETQNKVLDFVIEGFKKDLFIGLGLGGIEINYPPEMFVDVFKRARESGLRLVAHAGEVVGPESMWSAIEKINAERIGHGVRCLEDERLIACLQETQLPLEVSPTSNYNLGIIEQGKMHPIREMVDKGLLCTVNTDDPAMFSTSLNKEYDLLHSQGFSIEEIYQLNKNAVNASFLDPSEKTMLLNRMKQHEASHNTGKPN